MYFIQFYNIYSVKGRICQNIELLKGKAWQNIILRILQISQEFKQ